MARTTAAQVAQTRAAYIRALDELGFGAGLYGWAQDVGERAFEQAAAIAADPCYGPALRAFARGWGSHAEWFVEFCHQVARQLLGASTISLYAPPVPPPLGVLTIGSNSRLRRDGLARGRHSTRARRGTLR